MLVKDRTETPKSQKIKVRRMSIEGDQSFMDTLKKEMINYIVSLQLKDEDCFRLVEASGIKQIVEKFGEMILATKKSFVTTSNSAIQDQLAYYRER